MTESLSITSIRISKLLKARAHRVGLNVSAVARRAVEAQTQKLEKEDQNGSYS